MACADAKKIRYGTYMLSEEAGYWWDNARQRFEANGTMITWVVFKGAFLENYFLDDVCGRKEVECLELKQRNMTIADYASKFKGLYKCIKFEKGLCPEIKQFIGYQEIRQVSVMVNKCRIYDEDFCARSSHYKSASDKRNGNLNHGKLYGDPFVKGKQRNFDEKKPSEAGVPNSVRCYKYGEFGYRISECKSIIMNCFKFGKPGHRDAECRSNVVTCYNSG
ncbi:uncharacterized protein LOC127094297 [Lathyrus oleraceus]|uniref:uncharacterized protein LOC127094297 n=1 Tax=Pisum sativum TaxID=3888 RepID=UPI0021D398E1|nr:uncharacterized protein LOC127094297 [Pisum sativum]